MLEPGFILCLSGVQVQVFPMQAFNEGTQGQMFLNHQNLPGSESLGNTVIGSGVLFI